MKSFLETYGITLFTLVLIAILIAFAGSLGTTVRSMITKKINNVQEIADDKIFDETSNATDTVNAVLYTDGELVISQSPITETKEVATRYENTILTNDAPPAWTSYSGNSAIKVVRFEGPVKLKTCFRLFFQCKNLTEIKNIENLDTSGCTNMYAMFNNCYNLTSVDVSHFDTSHLTALHI